MVPASSSGIEGQQAEGKPVTLRADAAFAKPEIYEALEDRTGKQLEDRCITAVARLH